jgi:hypothetical protein
MRPLAAAAFLFVAVAAFGQDVNPHAGIQIVTDRVHTGPNVVRYDAPWTRVAAAAALDATVTTGGNLDRPVTSLRPIVTLLDARKPNDPASWGLLEREWYIREPLQGGGVRYVVVWPTSVADAWRGIVPEKRNDDGDVVRGETYFTIVEHPTARNGMRLRFGPIPSQVNSVELGDTLVVQGAKVKLGAGMIWDTSKQELTIAPGWTVEQDGKKFLPVVMSGKRYGIPIVELGDDVVD